MRAVVVQRHGGPEVLELSDVEAPTAAAKEVVVDVSAAGVNYRDSYERTGDWGGVSTPPFVAGIEGAGVVSALGPDVTELRVGDRVAWMHVQGSYAEQLAVPVENAVPVPDGLSDELAAAVLLQGVTAHYLCTTTHPVQEGETVLIHAAAGGTGLMLTQMVKLRGGRVIATVSSETKAVLATAAGADEVIVGYSGFAERVSELTGGEGVVAVYDGVGKDTVEEGLLCLRTRGVLVSYGAASGPPPAIDLNRLGRGSVYVTRPTSRDHTTSHEELLRRATAVFDWVAGGKLDVSIAGRYPLDDAARAQDDLRSRRTSGKLLLVVR